MSRLQSSGTGSGGGGGAGSLSGRSGSAAITNGSQTVSVVFSSAMPSAVYAVVAAFTNTVDSSPIYLIVVNTTKSSTGFTATFNAPTDSANYVLEWTVVSAS